MKIPVYEIEGNQYCKIDDITIAVSKATGSPRTRERCLADLIQEYSVFLDYLTNPDYVYKIYGKEITYKPIPTGFYRIGKWAYPCDDSYCGYTTHPYTYCDIPPKEDCKEHPAPNERNRKPKIIIKTLQTNEKIFTTYWDFALGLENDEESNFLFIEDLSRVYLLLIDAKIYLSCLDEEIDFIMPPTLIPLNCHLPQHEIDRAVADIKAESNGFMTVNSDGETLLFLDSNNKNYAPYLAIAIEMWERYFINGEKVQEGKATNSDKVNIEKLLDKYYPALSSNAKKTIAEVAVTKKGENKDNFKKK